MHRNNNLNIHAKDKTHNNNSNNNTNIGRCNTTSSTSRHTTFFQARSHGSPTQACAACKYQRRKCASDCILAPYFPHDRQRQFLNAHHLFGVSNIVKIVRHLDASAKDHAMRTIVFQSDARDADPVGGCYRIIRDLEQRISLAKAELEIVLHHLAICRAATMAQHMVPTFTDKVDSTSNGGHIRDNNNEEKWTDEYIRENRTSWACNANTEMVSKSFPQRNNDNKYYCNDMKDCTNDIRPILEQLAYGGDDDVVVREEEQFKIDANGNIVLSDNGVLIDEAKGLEYKEEDDCFSYVQDHNDLKAAETFFSLTNCDI